MDTFKENKVKQLLDMEFKLRANEFEDRKLVSFIREYIFEMEERTTISHYACYLFMETSENELDEYVSILIDLLIKYKLNSTPRLIDEIKKYTTSNKRLDIKEKNMLKGIDYIFDYLGGITTCTQQAQELSKMLHKLRENPSSFIENNQKYYKKEDLKRDLRAIFVNRTSAINDLVNELEGGFRVIQ